MKKIGNSFQNVSMEEFHKGTLKGFLREINERFFNDIFEQISSGIPKRICEFPIPKFPKKLFRCHSDFCAIRTWAAVTVCVTMCVAWERIPTEMPGKNIEWISERCFKIMHAGLFLGFPVRFCYGLGHTFRIISEKKNIGKFLVSLWKVL